MFLANSLSAAAPLRVSYDVKQPGIVSLGIHDAQGRLVRTLQSGKRQQPGVQEAVWDGTDDEHNACATGSYQLRGITSDIRAEYVLVAGNPGNPPYGTPDGKGGWNGHWGNPMGLANDGAFLYAQFSEEEVWGSQIKLDESGRVEWKANLSQADGNGFQLATATDGKYVYTAADVTAKGDVNGPDRRAVVWRTRADTGEYALWNNHGLLVGQPYRSGPRPFWELVEGDRTAPPTAFGLDGGPNPRGLAVREGRLYVSLYRENKIEIWDTAMGKRIGEIPGVARPQGLAIDAAGNLFVASGTQVLRIAPNGKFRPAIAQGLAAPYGVAVDAAGKLLVTDLGTSQQVKKFSTDGRLLWASGRPFGGKYVRDDFLFPVSVTVMPRGRIFVGEDAAPRRIVVLDPQGKVLQDWVGTLDIGPAAASPRTKPIHPRCTSTRPSFAIAASVTTSFASSSIWRRRRGAWTLTGWAWAPTDSPALGRWMVSESCAELRLSNLCAVAFASPQKGTALAMGGRNGIISTSDGGVSWQHARVDFGTDADVNLFDVTFAGDKTGWIIGRFRAVPGQDRWNAMLLRSEDAGAHWTEIDTRFADLNASGMAFADPLHGWIVGHNGMVLHTDDGARTWKQQASGVINHLDRVQFLSPLVGYAVGGAPKPSIAGVLLATTDGGKTWANVSPVGSSLAGLFFLDARHGWAVGGRGGGIETPMMILCYEGR